MAEHSTTQTVLLLYGPGQRYQVTDNYEIPSLLHESEVLVRAEALGLNPIDWKAPDFNFGLPTLPYIAGRELVGTVAETQRQNNRLRKGDQVLVISTDYRDLRKAAFQQFVVSSDFNTVRLPPHINKHAGSTLGVAFVAAAISLGVCMGVDFSNVLNGPHLLRLVRQIAPDKLPADVSRECLAGIGEDEVASSGEWLVIWGGSSTSANIVTQLARLVGLKIALVVDHKKHGLRLASHDVLRPDLLVDCHDAARAVDIIKSSVGEKLRFALDTTSRETSTHLLSILAPCSGGSHTGQKAAEEKIYTPPPSPSERPEGKVIKNKHLVGLTGLPKQNPPTGISYHTVPIKIFHEVAEVGEALVLWLERLLAAQLIQPPDVLGVHKGLDGVNAGLDQMRQGKVRGGRLSVNLEAL